MSDILLMEAANLFIGDHDPERSKHLKIQSLELPTLEFTTVDHAGGGAAMEVSWSMNQIKKLEPKFKLIGFDEDTYRAAGVGSNKTTLFTARGAIRRKQDSKLFEAVAIFRGSMGRVAPDNFEKANGMSHDHTIVDVTRYKLTIGNKVWFDVDYFATKRIRFGTDELAETRKMLGLAS